MTARDEVECALAGRAYVYDGIAGKLTYATAAKGVVITFSRKGAVTSVRFGNVVHGGRTLDKLAHALRAIQTLKGRGSSNANDRGNSRDRALRKTLLLERDGNGEFALCSTCPTIVDFESATVDRYPLAGADGGKYGPPSDLSNVRLQCQPCASKQGGKMSASRRGSPTEKEKSL